MNLRKLIFTENECYKKNVAKADERFTTFQSRGPKGIMVHSTGANNPFLKRYVGPDDGLLGFNVYGNHWNQPMSRQVCVHAFIGKLADGTVATYQVLPWNFRGWHAGGAANNTHIGFEICEDGLTDPVYFEKVYKEAVELCAMLCKEYNLTEKDIICHSEGHDMGIASNHGDVMHWFPKQGKSMDTFRADVAALLNAPTTRTVYRVQVGAFSKKANATQKLKAMKAAGFEDSFIVYDGTWWKVQAGSFNKKPNAEARLKKVEKAGFSGFIAKAQIPAK